MDEVGGDMRRPIRNVHLRSGKWNSLVSRLEGQKC